MLTPAQLTTVLASQAMLLAVAAVAVARWARRRVAAEARRRADRIEARLAGLEATLRRIEAALDRPKSTAAAPATGPRLDRPRLPTPARRRAERTPPPPPEADDLPGPTLIAVPDLSANGRAVGSQAEPARRASASGDLARRFGRVWAMADEGASADRIASATGQPIGQVELVLNLRRRLLDGPDDGRAGEVPA